jgi:hypothetical protein
MKKSYKLLFIICAYLGVWFLVGCHSSQIHSRFNPVAALSATDKLARSAADGNCDSFWDLLHPELRALCSSHVVSMDGELWFIKRPTPWSDDWERSYLALFMNAHLVSVEHLERDIVRVCVKYDNPVIPEEYYWYFKAYGKRYLILGGPGLLITDVKYGEKARGKKRSALRERGGERGGHVLTIECDLEYQQPKR